MNTLKLQMLAGAAVVGFVATTAQAQVLPAAEVHGAGASSINAVMTQQWNCIGQPNFDYSGNAVTTPTGLNQLGLGSNGSRQTIAPFNYTLASAPFDCATQEIQPDVQGRYISTGSGTGRTWWSTGAAPASVINPFPQSGNAGLPWTNVQFAFSDSPLTSSNITTYNTNAAAASTSNIAGAGAAIQIPLFVLPVAIAYAPVYGVLNNGASGTVNLSFNLQYPRSNGTGGLRLDRATYCGIFNGTITNFNDANFTRLNRNVSLRSLSDDLTRWNTVGVPIRLVGRSDTSGTTDIVNRALFAQCRVNNANPNDPNTSYTGTNTFTRTGDALPYNATGPNLLSKDSSTNMKGASSTTADLARTGGTTNRISGAFFNKSTLQIETDLGAEQPGMFMVANGSDGVVRAVEYQAPLGAVGTVTLNGKVTYVGADWVLPTTTNTTSLHSADLADPTTPTTFRAPTAKYAQSAFGTTLFPPQAIASTGAFNTADNRQLPADGIVTVTHTPLRSNVLDWTAVLHTAGTGVDGNPTPDIVGALGNPSAGYAITGTTQLLTYTCFERSQDRLAMDEFLGLHVGKVTRTSTGATVSSNLFRGTGTPLGLLAASGIGPLPTGWQAAVSETFTKRSTQASNGVTLGNLNLWIQSALPTATTLSRVTANPTCTAGTGA